MKELHKYLKVFIFIQLGACSADIIKKYLHFVNNPDWYSEPWYYSIRLTLILSTVAVIITTIAYLVVGRIIKKREQNETE